jgi:hypothetical protein
VALNVQFLSGGCNGLDDRLLRAFYPPRPRKIFSRGCDFPDLPANNSV